MEGRSARVPFVLLLAALLACGGGTSTGSQDAASQDGGVDAGPETIAFFDVDPVDLGRRDIGPEVADLPEDAPADPAGDGTADAPPETGVDAGPDLPIHCNVGSECDTGFCVPSPTGPGLQCAPSCAAEDCPQGWSCRSVEVRVGVVARVCLPGIDLCKPCTQDVDCRPLGLNVRDVCVFLSDGAGSACGLDCQKTGTCPDGTTCTSVDSGGKTWRQCLPDAGSCPCDPSWKDARTWCFRKAGTGRCRGERACNDGVESSCSAPEAVPETCNGVDDDCNGNIDDGFLYDGLYVTDEHCGDCATSCVGRIPHGSAACRLSGNVPSCRFMGCNPGYFESAPGTCTKSGRGACGPCATDEDCGEGLACLPVGGASFCTRTCDAAAADCGEGFACTAPGEGAATLCLRSTGGCGAEGSACLRDADCEDLDACTTGTCTGGSCAFVPRSCDDGNPCTTETCDRATGCVVEAVADEADCSDGDPCTLGDACRAGACVPGPRPDCDDANPCTNDACVGGLCTHAFNSSSEPCYEGPRGTQFVGTCGPGTRRCVNGAFGSCIGQVLPGPELCDGRDNDCNGTADEGCGYVGVDVRPVAATPAGPLGATGGRAEVLVGAGPGGLSSSTEAGYEIVLGFCGN